MAALKEPVKLALVHALACYDTPSQAVDMVKQEYGLSISRQQASAYDPTKASGKNMSKKLVAVFHATREAFLADVSTIPIAQQSYRLRVLQRALNKVEQQGNTAMIATLLEQAAKESGGAFTNRRELTGKDGGPVQTQTESVQFYLPDNGR
jgi:hypothetical protein